MEDEDFLKAVVISDLHFGNPKINPADLYAKLRQFLYPELRGCHIIFLAGDIYDGQLTVDSLSYKYASVFLKDLFLISADTGMQVRLLHGTYTHDRDQLSVASALALPETRSRIINDIYCEEITDLVHGNDTFSSSLRVGYIPDNLSYKRSEEVIAQLKRAMTCYGWSRLDMIIGHGTFAHVLKPNSGHAPLCLFEKEQFDFVDGPIVMGHIHTPGKSDRFYYCGSFERMAHGEEENKGFYVFTCDYTKKHWGSRFVVDKDATPFVSIELSGLDAPKLIEQFKEQVEAKIPTHKGFVRVIHASPEMRSLLHKVCAQNYPDIRYSSKTNGEIETSSIQVTDIELDLVDDVKPDINNLGGLVYRFLQESNSLDTVTEDDILSHVDTVIEQLGYKNTHA